MPPKLLEAMAKREGYGADPKNRPTRNNNPGNIEWGKFARAEGATRIEEIPKGYVSTARYAYFPTAELGWNAMRKRLTTGMYKGLTIRQAISKWAPPTENDTEAYIVYVCYFANVTDDMLVEDVLKEE